MKKNEKLVYNGFNKIAIFETEIKGRKVEREKLIVKSAVAGIVIDENNNIGLVTQYRPTINQHTKEIPAGVLDKEHLSPTEVLIEELMEECEIPKEEILSISKNSVHDYYMISGTADAKISLYEIHVKSQKNKTVSDADVESVEWVSIDQFKRYIDSGQIVDAKTIIAFYYSLNRLK